MFIYNVTFIHSYWNMSTTIHSEIENPVYDSEDWVHLVKAASEIIYSTCSFSPIEYADVDIEVEYVGEEAV